MTDQRQDQDRTIRVFVSSTFRDMQEDRDYLVKFVFPQLRKLCESRGVTWGEVDLRWGITEEEAAEGKLLPLCAWRKFTGAARTSSACWASAMAGCPSRMRFQRICLSGRPTYWPSRQLPFGREERK